LRPWRYSAYLNQQDRAEKGDAQPGNNLTHWTNSPTLRFLLHLFPYLVI